MALHRRTGCQRAEPLFLVDKLHTSIECGRFARNETTQAIYQALGTGDVPFILSKVSEDCKWDSWTDNTAAKSGKIPYIQTRQGKAGVGEFFGAMTALELHDFQVHNFLEVDPETLFWATFVIASTLFPAQTF